MSNTAQSLAGTRIASLLDANSFVEIGAAVTARSTDFNLTEKKAPSDGVVTGYGVIDGRLVYVYSQDAGVLGGTVGEMHAKKIASLYDMALKMGAPIIGIVDCAGLRLEEATDALSAFGTIFAKSALASGIIPQVTVVLGSCGGGMALLPTLTDFTFVERTKGKIFVNSPNALAGSTQEKCDTSDAAFQGKETGLVDFVGEENEIFAKVRELISYLPSNNEDTENVADCEDDLNRTIDDAEGFAGNAAGLVSRIADDGAFFEIKAEYGDGVAAGFIRLNGQTTGVVANRSVVYDEEGNVKAEPGTVLCASGARKAAEFVNFCDAFEIPVLSLTNVTGFETTLDGEKRIGTAVGKLAYAFASATVPKVNIVVGKAYGSAAVAMNSKALGADLSFAWEKAEIGMMDAGLASKIMYPDADAAELAEKAKAYRALQSSVDCAAARGYVDAVIAPADTRKYAIGAFEMLYTKKEEQPSKKHGTV